MGTWSDSLQFCTLLGARAWLCAGFVLLTIFQGSYNFQLKLLSIFQGCFQP